MENPNESTAIPANDEPDVLVTAVETLGRDVLSAMVEEMKRLPNAWHKLPFMEQDASVSRLRQVTRKLIRDALNTILRGRHPAVVATLESITFRKGITARLDIDENASQWQELVRSKGKPVLIVMADPEEFEQALDDVKAIAAQKDWLVENNKVETIAEQQKPAGSFADMMRALGGVVSSDDNALADGVAACRTMVEELALAVPEGMLSGLTSSHVLDLYSWLRELGGWRARRDVEPDRREPTPACPEWFFFSLDEWRLSLVVGKRHRG